MCTKLAIYIKNGEATEYFPEDNLVCEVTSVMRLCNATIYWHYKNVWTGVNDTVTYGLKKITFKEGYWKFNMIQDKLKQEKVTVTYDSSNGTCQVTPEGENLDLGKLGVLLGFPESHTISSGTASVSPRMVDVNLGLRYVTINCTSINASKNFDTDGRQSHALSSFPITPDQNLGSVVIYFGNIMSVTPISNGHCNSLLFTVDTNIGDHVDLDVYFETLIKR